MSETSSPYPPIPISARVPTTSDALTHQVAYYARGDLLDLFAAAPRDSSIWEEAYEWVLTEGDSETNGIADDIVDFELIDLAERVRALPQAERYSLMTERSASTGQPWFDVLETFSSPQIEAAKETMLQKLIDIHPYRVKFESALDIGTGTGKSLKVLEKVAKKVVGVDRQPGLTAVARTVAKADTGLVQGAADELPFVAASFDLVTSSGLIAALDQDTATAFYIELERILTADGLYLDGTYYPTADGQRSLELARIQTTAKGMLADMIVDTVSGKFESQDCLSDEQTGQLLDSLGMTEAYALVDSSDGVSRSAIRIITKTA